MSKLNKEQINYLEELKSASNDRVLEMYECAIVPDDYDGMHTGRGAWELEESRQELYKRLIKYGFLPRQS